MTEAQHDLLPLTPDLHPDDRSSYLHRQAVGWSGLLLVPALLVLMVWRPVSHTGAWPPLDSISCYYHSGGVAAFVGIICALSYFLFTYRGYGNKKQWLDLVAAYVAGIAAAGVVLFPCTPTNGFEAPTWWRDWMGTAHNVSATVLFSSFAFFSLVLFRRGKSTDTASKRRRTVYLVCGLVIVAALVWAWVEGRRDRSIFHPEALALFAFATSWLVKGRAGKTVGALASNLRHHTRRTLRNAFMGE